MLADGASRSTKPSLQRVLMFLEIALGGLLTAGGIGLIAVALVTGHHDQRHGGAYVFVGGVFVVFAGLAILIPGLALRMRHPAKWALQLIPLAGLIYWLTV
jgi:hypothetical protein